MTDSVTRKAALYLRSTKDRADVSIGAQREALQALAAERGFTIVAEFADSEESGKDEDRPGFQSLYAAVRNRSRGWDAILVLDTSRLARRRSIATRFEDEECARRGVKVIYKNLAGVDPDTGIIIKSVFQGMDEWHSVISKRKGIAGMRQNVQTGWRAGGRAPNGYRLQHEPTGAVRDGRPVLKSRLVPDTLAPAVAAYLSLRAAGARRRSAKRQSSITMEDTTLIGMEWNALTYAGCTVWNVHGERQGGQAIAGTKRRPRSEWVVKEGTHEALITRGEAEALLHHLETKAQSRRDRAPEDYLLSGLLYVPTGKPWHGCRDDGIRHYRPRGGLRVGRYGHRVKAERIERSVVDAIKVDLRSPQLVEALVAEARRISSPTAEAKTIERAHKEIATFDRRINALMATLADTAAKRPLLEQIERWECEREEIRARIAQAEAKAAIGQKAARVTERHVTQMLNDLSAELETLTPEDQRDLLRGIVSRIELDPVSLTGRIGYEIPVGVTGDKLASPRGFEPRLPP